MRILIDTNVYISAMLFGGVPLKALELARKRCGIICFSYIADELCTVLTSKKFAWSEKKAEEACELLLQGAIFVEPDQVIAVARDAKDDPILACAVAGNADLIMTGDKDLLTLKTYRQTSILTPKRFLLLWQEN